MSPYFNTISSPRFAIFECTLCIPRYYSFKVFKYLLGRMLLLLSTFLVHCQFNSSLNKVENVGMQYCFYRWDYLILFTFQIFKTLAFGSAELFLKKSMPLFILQLEIVNDRWKNAILFSFQVEFTLEISGRKEERWKMNLYLHWKWSFEPISA